MNLLKFLILGLFSFGLVFTSAAQEEGEGDFPTVNPSLLVTTPRLSPDDIPSETPEQSCEDKLRAHIDKLLKEDRSGILEAQLNLTILKLAKKTIGGQHKTLEDMIKKDMTKLNQLNAQNPATLERLNQLYDANANDDLKSVYNNISVLKSKSASLNYIGGVKIENDAVASYVLYESMLNEPNSPFTKNDVAIAWLSKKIKAQTKSAALSISDHVARYTGLVKDATVNGTKKAVKAASTSDINKKMNEEKAKIDKFMNDAKTAFMQANPDCAQDAEFSGECLSLTKDISGDLLLDIDNLNSKASSNFTAAMKNKIFGGGSFTGQSLNTCEGKYYDRTKAKVIHSTRTSTGTPDSHGKHHAEHASHHPKPQGFYFPPMTCSWHGKKFFLEHIVDKKEQCCKDKITTFIEYSPYLMLETGGDCRVYYGIPYVAEVGVKGGVEIEVGVGGKITLNLETCSDEGCLAIKGKFRPFLAVYAEVGAGLATVEGGVRWEPYIEGKYCKAKGAEKGKGKVEAVLGTAYLYGQYSLGWGMKTSSFNYALASSSAKLKLLEF